MSRPGFADPKGTPFKGSLPATRAKIWEVTQLGYDTPAYTMQGRPKTSPGRLNQSPSPGDYAVPSRLCEGPKYPFGIRPKYQGDSAAKAQPGPAEYNVTDATKGVKNRSPSYSFGGRHGDVLASKNVTPGPDVYQTPRMAREGIGFTMTSRRADLSNGKNVSPGPGAYSPDNKHFPASPAFSMTSRPGTSAGSPGKRGKKGRAGDWGSPGPGAYKPLDGCPHKPQAPGFSMGRRLPGPKAPATPGPIYNKLDPITRRWGQR